jgi:adenylosuccinate lyase
MSDAPSSYDTYTSPLAARNASEEMLRLWSPRHKFNTWRRIWLAVAEAQHELGLPVSKEQVEELRAVVERGITDDEMRAAEKYERELRHDVMAHVHALGDSCPKAKGIIHLGMTSQDVVCNADLAIIGEAVGLTSLKIARTVIAFGDMALRVRGVATLGFTHYQPAQPVTVGRRAAGWAFDLKLCESELFDHTAGGYWLRGLKGATGTQASFLALLGDDSGRVDELESAAIYRAIRTPQGSGACILQLTGQTYPRVLDAFLLADLAATASVLHKIATDIRLLSNRKELDEPFESKQIGSSAMPYKRNPMRCERICGLTRFVMNLVGNAYDTAATQWLERTLDDSSNRRLSLPEAFLALDGALDLMHNVASGLIVHEAMVRKNLMAELPFMATENILMACVKLGGDRQQYHEVIRQHAQAAGMRVKQEGLDNDLLERLKNDPAFHPPSLKAELDWEGLLDPMKYVGRSVEQTERFIREVVEPLRSQYGEAIAKLGVSAPKV